ncbi:MAG: hypothetical protein JXM69_20210 [Anaerolineae bacterium]|nr:hypothetical protein [Anaerolineae bacterium]
MEQIQIWVKNKEKAHLLLELLGALDFVELVKTDSADETQAAPTASADFFALAGLWAGRDITLESIRRQGWPRQPYDSV